MIENGTKLDRPECCTDKMYDLMQQCWRIYPQDRITFRAIIDYLLDREIHALLDALA